MGNRDGAGGKTMGILLSLAIAVIIWYAVMCIYLYFNQKSLVYFPDASSFEHCANFKDAEQITWKGTRMYYKNNGSKVAVFYHGNAGTACDNKRMKEFLEKLNYSYVFVEYAGYANDKRKPGYSLILQDVEHTIEFVKTLKPKKVIVMGESLGSGAAAYHASIAEPNVAVLIVPFNSFRELAQEKYPLYPVSLLLTERYDNEKWLKSYTGNVLLIHGTKDSTVPMHHSRKLFNTLPTKDKTYAAIENADHNDVYEFRGTWDAVERALS
jgi:pimeloyl-ACP methyl ester carboxylesterase